MDLHRSSRSDAASQEIELGTVLSASEAGQFDGKATPSQGAIERRMRQDISKLRGSAYHDQFDWSVYDRLLARLEGEPRGGVVFNKTLRLVNYHSSCSKCLYALEIDSYGRGCVHDCGYCYAKDQLTKYGYWNRPQPFPVDLAEVRKIFFTVFETDRASKWRSILEQKIPIRIGSMSDSFMWIDTRYGITKELLRILKFYKYPYVIFTRSDLVAHDSYIELLDKELAAIQFSISGNNDSLMRRIEPGAPKYQRRLLAMEKLVGSGFWVAARINPMFPKYPDGYFTDHQSVVSRFGSSSAIPVLPLYDDNFIAEIADTGAQTVLAGFVRLSSVAVASLSKNTGVRIRDLFRPDLWAINGDKKFSDSEIAYYYRWMKKECDKHGVRFSTCYIGNGIKDYFGYQSMWTNKKDCCDIRGNVEGFRASCQEIPWSERKRFTSNIEAANAAEQVETVADLEISGIRGVSDTHERLL